MNQPDTAPAVLRCHCCESPMKLHKVAPFQLAGRTFTRVYACTDRAVCDGARAAETGGRAVPGSEFYHTETDIKLP